MSTIFGDLIIESAYPAVDFDALETSNEYHEDREVTWTNFVPTAVSYLYRVVNANFDGTNWNLKNTSLRAYAHAQLPDGSIGFYASPLTAEGGLIDSWAPYEWAGSGNFTRFNAADYGMDPGQSAVNNAAFLEAALNDAAIIGGRVFIPAGTYQCNEVIIPAMVGSGPSVGLVIEGAGGSTVLRGQSGQNLFSSTGNNDYLGLRIRDIKFLYPNDGELGNYYAVYSTSSSVICEGCYFVNWPFAVYGVAPISWTP